MTKFHISPETGQPGPCKATQRCPFGGDSEHFDSPESARAGFELVMRVVNQDPTASPLDRGISFKTMEDAERIARLAAREGQPAFVEHAATVIYSDMDFPAEEDYADDMEHDRAIEEFQEDFEAGRLPEIDTQEEFIVHSFADEKAAQAFDRAGHWGGGFATAAMPKTLEDEATYTKGEPNSDPGAWTQAFTSVKYFAPKAG